MGFLFGSGLNLGRRLGWRALFRCHPVALCPDGWRLFCESSGTALMNYAKNALPARKGREACREFPIVSESIIRGLLHICARRPPYREVDHQGPRNDRPARHKSPGTIIVAVIPVVSEHKVLISRNHKFPVSRQCLHLSPPVRVNIRIRVHPGRKIVSELTGSGWLYT